MKDLLLYMAKSLVDNPDSVTVTEVEGETTVLELRVAPEDMGKLIGRQGRIAKEIRTADGPVFARAPVQAAPVLCKEPGKPGRNWQGSCSARRKQNFL